MLHSHTDITVAICLHNSRTFIDATLTSVLDQTHRDFEVVLVDDGSTDGCLDHIARRFSDDRIRAIRQPCAGLGAARATSVSNARGRYVAFLDHDDLWERDKLAVQLAVVRKRPDAGLVFCPCTYIDVEGRALHGDGLRTDPAALDLSEEGALAALLRCGCFIDLSSVLMPRAVIERAGGFNRTLLYAEDFDLWLRVARTMALVYHPDPLVRRRLHPQQLTQQRPDVALMEERDVLRPVVSSATYPAAIRHAVATILAGEHCACASRLLGLGRHGSAVRAAAGALAYPGGPRLAASYWASRTATGRMLRDTFRRSRPDGHHKTPNAASACERAEVTAIWFDATPLDSAQTGYFTFTLELLRTLLTRCPPRVTIHADVSEPVIPRLGEWLGAASARLRVHPVAAALTLRRSHVRPRQTGGRGVLEVVIWQGRFRFAESERIAVVQDLTPRLLPEVHTDGNLRDFEDYVRYATRWATRIATVSATSRQDIVDHLPVYPPHVHVIPARVHGRFLEEPTPPSADRRRRLGVPGRYVLSVGTLEPRKNLRRLIDAVAAAAARADDDELTLVIAGPLGWDEGLPSFIEAHPFRSRIRLAGFVPADDLPALYAGASAFVYPSLYEGLGLPVLEAMCCGGLVVTSRVSAMPEVLGDAGASCDPYDADDMTRALREALAMPTERVDRLRQAARRRALSLLSRWAVEPPLPGLENWRQPVS